MPQSQLPDYLFPVALEDAIPLDAIDCPPPFDLQCIGIGDPVVYAYVNDWGGVERRFSGVVVGVDYATDRALVDSPTEIAPYWCAVARLSLNGTAATAASVTAAVPAA